MFTAGAVAGVLPADGIEIVLADDHTMVLSRSRIANLLAVASAIYAGIRRQEIQRLRWEDIDLGKHWLTVQQSKSEAGTRRRLSLAQSLPEEIMLFMGHADVQTVQR